LLKEESVVELRTIQDALDEDGYKLELFRKRISSVHGMH
jgi:hypothetical protein